MEYNLHLHPESFDLIKSGKKKIEFRLLDEKRQQYQVGDTLVFISRETDEKLAVVITEIVHDKSFKILLDKTPVEILGWQSKEENLKVLELFYSSEQQKQYGVIGIRFERIEE